MRERMESDFMAFHRSIPDIRISSPYIWMPIAFLAGAFVYWPAFIGMDTDFHGAAMFSERIASGLRPYSDFFTHKPPLFFYMLLPGSILGGSYWDYFAVYLGMVGVFHAVVAYFLFQIVPGRSGVLASVFTLVLYTATTFLPNMSYGNLNGSIMIPIMIVSLIAVLFLDEAVRRLAQGRNADVPVFIAGLLCAIGFWTRFSLAPYGLVVVMGLFLGVIHRVQRPVLIRLGLLFAASQFLVTLLILWVLGFPLGEMFDQLITFNRAYAAMGNASMSEAVAENVWVYFLTVGKMVFPIVAVFLVWGGIALGTIFLQPGKMDLSAIVRDPESTIRRNRRNLIVWLLLLAGFEFGMVLLQGQKTKAYPYFPCVLYLSIVAGIAGADAVRRLSRSTGKVLFKPVLLAALVVFFLLYEHAIHKNVRRISEVLEFPDAELIEVLKQHIEGLSDLYTFDYAAYLYLETGTLPPIGHNSYVPFRWTAVGTKPEQVHEIMRELERAAPKVVVRREKTRIPGFAQDFFSHYRKIGSYPVSYHPAGGPFAVYLRREKSSNPSE